MSGAVGRPNPKSFKLKMNVGDGLSLAPAAAATEDHDPPQQLAAAADPPPPADNGEAAATLATPPPSRTRVEKGRALRGSSD